MKSNYKELGELIQNVDVKNKDLHCTNLRGLSMNKEFRASTSNIVGTDLSKYKIVSQKQFACDFMSAIRVHKIPIAFNTENEEILVSPAYAVFEVKDEDVILPEYLMIWFSRPEFDRYVDFRCDAAIRGGYGWNELCDTRINLPSLNEQKEAVRRYQAITSRIALKRQINDNLEAAGLAIFREQLALQPDALIATPLYDLAEYINGTSFDADEYATDGLPIIKIAELKDGITSSTQYFSGKKDAKYLIHDAEILFSWSGNPDTSIDAFIWSHGDAILNQHTFKMLPYYGRAFTYFMLKYSKPDFVKAAMGKQTTGLGHVTVKDLQRLTLPFSKELALQFDRIASPILDNMFLNLKEINTLIELRKQIVMQTSIL